MTKKTKIILLTIAIIPVAVVSFPFLFLIVFFGYQGFTIDKRVDRWEEALATKGDSFFQQILLASEQLWEQHGEQEYPVRYGSHNEFEIPEEFSFLSPQAVFVDRRGVTIYLVKVMDTGALLHVDRLGSGEVQIYGTFGDGARFRRIHYYPPAREPGEGANSVKPRRQD